MFCGLTSFEAAQQCFADAAGTGYGNHWYDNIASPTLAYNGSGSVYVRYTFRSDSEPVYDSTHVCLDVYRQIAPGPPPDSGWIQAAELKAYDGVHGPAQDSLNVTSILETYGSTKYRIRVLFASDPLWSDEDGRQVSSCGAFGFDDVSVIGGGVDYFSDFEAAADWSAVTWTDYYGMPGWEYNAADIGDFAHTEWAQSLVPAITDDPCAAAPGGCGLADSVLVLFDPEGPSNHAHPFLQDNMAASPPIYVGAYPYCRGFVLHFEMFAKISQCNGWAGVGEDGVYVWSVRYSPSLSGQCWSEWADYNSLGFSGGLPVCGTREMDVSSLVPAGIDSVQVAVGFLSLCSYDIDDCCYTNNAAPYFDNVCLGAYGNEGAPVLSMDETWRWQDQFQKDGELFPAGTADTRTGLQLVSGNPSAYGDTLICRSGTDDTEVYLVFRLPKLGPDINKGTPFFTTLFPGTLDGEGNPTGAWQSARMDTAEATSGGVLMPASGYWMAAFHEDDPTRLVNGLAEGAEILPNGLFTPGTRVEYFLKSRFTGGTAEFLLPDTTGGDSLEFEILPMMELVGMESRWPRLLLVNHSVQTETGGTYAVQAVKDALTAAGFAYDEYDRLAPLSASSACGSGVGRPSPQGGYAGPGATVSQLAAYQAVFVYGGSYRYTLSQYDVPVLDGWLGESDSSAPRFVWVTGDEALRSLSGTWGSTFMKNRLCASSVSYSYYSKTGDNALCLPLDGWSSGRIACAPLGGPENEHLTLVGNRCPRQFDIGGLSGVAGCSGVRELDYNETRNGETYAASVSGAVQQYGGAWFKSLIEGYDFAAIRSDASLGPPDCGPDAASAEARANWVQCVLGDFAGLAAGAYCTRSSCISVDGPSGPGSPGAAYITHLEQSFPNPMNPAAAIRFTVAAPGRVVLRIYDISGRVVRTLFEKTVTAPARFEISWDGRNDDGVEVGSGVFFYQLEARGYRSARKLLILR
jgi:hypothetical protein